VRELRDRIICVKRWLPLTGLALLIAKGRRPTA
jgi:hypothetical protein